MDNIIKLVEFFVSYSIIFIFFYLFGRASVIIFQTLSKEDKDSEILFLSTKLMYPLIGVVVCSNVLVLLNFVLPLKSLFVKFILCSFLLVNFKKIKIDFKATISIKNAFYYLIIPTVLLISSFNVSFHYDAGYYHLNNQNWLRESNTIFGFVNIFWPFGMSSIYEYISSILWVSKSFLQLHQLNIFFVHLFYIFIFDNFSDGKPQKLRNLSIFLLIFSLLDNFGFSGGRNGFIYLEGVGKQDVSTGIIFFFVSILSLLILNNKKILSKIEFSIYSMLILYLIQLKLNTVIITFLYILVVVNQKQLGAPLQKIINNQKITIFFSGMWLTKTYITTGCLIFPLSVSCLNKFDWYLPNSTIVFEEITRGYSLSYQLGENFFEWVNTFTKNEFYTHLFLNFAISSAVLILFKILFFENIKINPFIRKVLGIFILLNFVYLLLYGPIPRYAIGILLTSLILLAFSTGEIKFKLHNISIYVLILLSVGTLVRVDSYKYFIENKPLIIYNPLEEAKYIQSENGLLKPDEGDQCWINLECTMNNKKLIISDGKLFKTAFSN
jgi:hypothetical protein